MATKKKEKDVRVFVDDLTTRVVRTGEAMFDAQVIASEAGRPFNKGVLRLGGMCSCCGCDGHVEEIDDWSLVFKAGLVDEDGVYYPMLCGQVDGSGCLESIRAENAKRSPTYRDEAAALVTDLLEDDRDGARAMMEDFDAMGFFADGE